LESGFGRPDDALVAFADGAAAFFALDRLAWPGRSFKLVSAGAFAATTSSGLGVAFSCGASATSSTSIALRPPLVIRNV
jgi:hypothetical protein